MLTLDLLGQVCCKCYLQLSLAFVITPRFLISEWKVIVRLPNLKQGLTTFYGEHNLPLSTVSASPPFINNFFIAVFVSIENNSTSQKCFPTAITSMSSRRPTIVVYSAVGALKDYYILHFVRIGIKRMEPVETRYASGSFPSSWIAVDKYNNMHWSLEGTYVLVSNWVEFISKIQDNCPPI